MWNKTKPEAKDIVTKIEIASDKIVKNLVITDVSMNALRSLKNAISVISSASDDTLSTYVEILNRILNYVNEAVLDPGSIEFCAERVNDHVKDYLQEHRIFDAEYEEYRDKEIKGHIAFKRTTADIEEIEGRMNAIKEEQINADYPTGSAKYMTLVSDYNRLDAQLKDKQFKLATLQKMNDMNSYSRSAVEKNKSLEEMKAGSTMSLNEYTEMVYENKALESEALEEFEAFRRVAAEASASSMIAEIDDYGFKKSIEDTLLERLYRSHVDSYESQVADMPKDDLLAAMLQVIRKVDDIANVVANSEGERKKQAAETKTQLDELLATTASLAAMREDMSGDITKEVEYCLSRNPADIQAAHYKIRTCIELYCRFTKGIDFNDKLFFGPGKTVEEKFASANETEHDKELAEFYKNTNGFIHTENKVLFMTDEEKTKEVGTLRKIAETLHRWGIDKYDYSKGMQLHYVTRDQMLKQMIDDGTIDARFLEVEGKTRGRLYYYFGQIYSSAKFMREQGIDVPDIKFKSCNDIKEYFNRDNTPAKNITPKPQDIKSDEVSPFATSRNRSPRLESEILKFFPNQKYGFIKNPNGGKEIYFKIKEDDVTGFVVGARVSYVMGTNQSGPCAEKVTLVASAEVTC